MRNVRAILIDPFAKTVSEVEHDADNYKAIYAKLSHETMPVDCFTVVAINDVDSIFVDDEGLLKSPTHFFRWHGYPQPLAGKGLILGCDDEGETIACAMSLDEAKANVSFTDDIRLSHFDSFERDEDTAFGRMHVIGHRPVFITPEPGLVPFRVSLHEDKGDKHYIIFECMAEDDDDAAEQALNAYPNGEVVHTSKQE